MKKLLLTLTGALSVSLPAPTRATILLNEVHLNVPNADDNYEFFELKSTTNGVESCAGLSLLIINNDFRDADDGTLQNLGEITEVYSLNEYRTGSNGLLLLGNGYAGNPRGGPWSGFVDAATNVADPSGMGDSDIGSNDGLTILLVSGFNGVPDVNGLMDVDVDNDNLLDWTQTAAQNPPANAQFQSAPWSSVVDSFGTRDRGTDNGNVIVNPYVTIPAASYWPTWSTSTLGNRDPDTMARQLNNNTANSSASWYGGKLTGAASTTVTYQTNRIFGPGVTPMLGEVTPGRPNLAASLPATSFRINEIGLNPVGDNDRFQFIEIINTNGQARSLAGHWLILLDSYDGSAGTDDSPGGGQILEKWDLSSMATGSNGLLLIGNNFSSSYNSFNDLASAQCGFGDPVQSTDDEDVVISTSFGEGDVRFKRGLTMLLVQNFVDPVNDDLDAADDGTLDVALTSLGTIVDQVGFNQVGKTGVLGATYSTVNLRTVMPAELEPRNISRKAGNLTVGTAAWYGGDYDNGSPGFNFAFNRIQQAGAGGLYDPWFGGFRGAGTPGQGNLSAPVNPASPPVPASLRISEVMFNPTDKEGPNSDSNHEYIELRSTTGGISYLDGIWIVVVDLKGSLGSVVESFPMDGSVSGLNGITILGDGYDSSTPYISDGALTPFATGLDPIASIGGDDLPNDGLMVMVLRGPKTGAGNPFTISADGLTLSGDLDPENDGVLLPPASLADEVMDSIAVSDINPGAGYGWISTSPFKAHHVGRYPSNTTAHSGAAYYFGQLPQTPTLNPGLEYTSVFAGAFKGAGSPGRPNHAAATAPTTVGEVVFSEVHVNPPGADRNFEFVEFRDTAGRQRSLNSYYLLMFDNVGPNTGAVRAFWSLDGMATGANGHFVLGNRYPLGGVDNPWSAIMRTQTALGDPTGREGLDSSLSDESLGQETDNLNVAFLLVRGFNRSIGFDLDQKVGAGGAGAADSSGDGIFDQSAWSGGINSGIHDSIMYRDLPLPAVVPAPPYAPYDGFTYGLADLTSAFLTVNYYHPESFARFHGENAPNSPGNWYGGDLVGGVDGNDGDDTTYVTSDPTHPPFPAGFTGRATPGQPNLARNGTADTDADGISDFLELAFNSNPSGTDSPSPLPVVGTVNVAGTDYASLTYRRIKGGTTSGSDVYTAEAYTYTVESSLDLQAWTSNGSTVDPVGDPAPNADGVTETVTFRLLAPLTDSAGKAFMRLRVGRF